MAEELKQAPAAEAPKAEEANKAEQPKAEGEQHKDRRDNGKRRPRPDHKGPRPEKKDDGFEDRVVFINRVSKTVKGGRRMKFTALVVVGDHKGKYGFALGKAAEVPDAIKKATESAKKNLHSIKLVKGNTISHDVIGKFGACNVYLKPATEGTGIIAGGPVRAILELSGVQNVCSKVYGSRAPINVIRATSQGLDSLKSFHQVKALRAQGEEAKAE